MRGREKADMLDNKIAAKWQSCFVVGWDQSGCVSSRAITPPVRASDHHIYISTTSCPQRLLYDDASPLRQGDPSAPAAFGTNFLSLGDILFSVGLMQHFGS